MKTITISRKTLAGDLVVLPRKDYERLLKLAHVRHELEKGLTKSLAQLKQGKTIGPFASADELVQSLNR